MCIEHSLCYWRLHVRCFYGLCLCLILALLLVRTLTYKSLLAKFYQESLKYRLLGSEGDIGSWGHEYVR